MNVQKAVLPGLWQVLAGGGLGSAHTAYPPLLSLLRALVEQVGQGHRGRQGHWGHWGPEFSPGIFKGIAAYSAIYLNSLININCERNELSSAFNGPDFRYIYIYISGRPSFRKCSKCFYVYLNIRPV